MIEIPMTCRLEMPNIWAISASESAKSNTCSVQRQIRTPRFQTNVNLVWDETEIKSGLVVGLEKGSGMVVYVLDLPRRCNAQNLYCEQWTQLSYVILTFRSSACCDGLMLKRMTPSPLWSWNLRATYWKETQRELMRNYIIALLRYLIAHHICGGIISVWHRLTWATVRLSRAAMPTRMGSSYTLQTFLQEYNVYNEWRLKHDSPGVCLIHDGTFKVDRHMLLTRFVLSFGSKCNLTHSLLAEKSGAQQQIAISIERQKSINFSFLW